MPTSTLSSPTISTPARKKSVHPAIADLELERVCSQEVARAQAALQALQESPADASCGAALRTALRDTALAVAALPKSATASTATLSARELVRAVAVSGVLDHAVATEIAATKSWPSLLAHMLVTPAWLSPTAPAFESVPDWMWGEYAAWVFAAPSSFNAVGQADLFAAHFEGRITELAHWVVRNPGAAAVRSAWESYLESTGLVWTRGSSSSLRKIAEQHAGMLARFHRIATAGLLADAEPMEGRRLRVGVIVPQLDASTATQAALPLFLQLDKDRFEVEVFCFESTGAQAEGLVRDSALALQVLTSELSEQVRMLLEARLDIAMFAAELAGASDAMAKLALHRLAPLQVATSAHASATTGHGTIDLFVSGCDVLSPADANQFGERLGLIDGPARTFNHDLATEEATLSLDRAAVGLPADAAVFVTAANYTGITPETQRLWAQLLARVPGSYLVVQRLANDACAAEALAAGFDRALAEAGVATERLVLAASPLSSMANVVQLLQLGDVFLDPLGTSDDTVLIAALGAGLPAVTKAGDTLRSRRGAALLRSIGRGDAVATDDSHYISLAAQLGTDSAIREQAKEAIKSAMETMPRVLDGLATSEALSALLRRAFEERVRLGAETFRAERAPVMLPSGDADAVGRATTLIDAGDFYAAAAEAREALRAQPAEPRARAILGRALTMLAEPVRAVDYLLAAVQVSGAEPANWFHLARALQDSGRVEQALQALESALRLDPKNVAGWRMLIEVAERSGAYDIANEAREELRLQVPDAEDTPVNPLWS